MSEAAGALTERELKIMKRNRKPHGRAAIAFASGGLLIVNAVHLWGHLSVAALVRRARAARAKLFIGIVLEGADAEGVAVAVDDAVAEVVGVRVHRLLRRKARL